MAVTTGKIDRKYMAHFLDAGSLCGGKHHPMNVLEKT